MPHPLPSARRLLLVGLAALAAGGPAAAVGAPATPAKSFFRHDELAPQVVLDGNTFYIPTYFGPTGMVGWVLGEYLVVREIEPGSPAAGVVEPNDMLASAGGKPLGAEALKSLGQAVTEAEKAGKLELGLLRAGRKMNVVLKLPAPGAYAKDWPRDCAKSRKILLGACAYLDKIQNFDGSFNSLTRVGYALNGLTWLASEDPQYLENARRLAYYYRDHNNLDAQSGTVVWGWGYMGIFLAEYYLKTGDRNVLPVMARTARILAKWQQPSGTWGHGPNPGPGYVQGGSLNAAAGAAWIALLLIKEAGVEVSPAALDKATRFFARFADRGTVPYGNHRPEFALTGNSKDALASIGFAILGDRPKAEIYARLVTDGYRHRTQGHTGGFLGFAIGNIAGLNNPHRPDYRRMLDHWTWLLDVSRSYDGGFLFPHTIIDSIYTYRGPVLGTGGVALVFAAPSKSLRIFGAPKSVFAAKDLPADLAEAVTLYQAGKLDAAGAKAKGEDEYARQLRKAINARHHDVKLSLLLAESETALGKAPLAVTILTNLRRLGIGENPQLSRLLAKVKSDKYAAVFEAQKVYEKYKWLTPVWPEAKQAFEKLAKSKEAGVYAKLAREELARPADSHKWSHLCESLFARVGEGETDDWKKTEWGRRTMLRTAGLKGGNWPRIVAAQKLRAAGLLRDDFVKDWQALIPSAGLEGATEKPTWRYLGVARDGQDPPAGWAEAGFDDGAWKRAPGPLSRERGAALAVARGAARQYVRIAFTADTPDFAAARLYYTNPRRRAEAVVYLNGRPVAWLAEASAAYRTVDLKPAAVKLLVKGRNVLAVRSSGAEMDIGLYAPKKGGRP